MQANKAAAFVRMLALSRPHQIPRIVHRGFAITPATLRGASPPPVQKPSEPAEKKHLDISNLKQKYRETSRLKKADPPERLEDKKSQLVEFVIHSQRYLGLLYKDPQGQPLVLAPNLNPVTINENQIAFHFPADVKYGLADIASMQSLSDDLLAMLSQEKIQSFWRDSLEKKKSFTVREMAAALFVGSTTPAAMYATHRVLTTHHLLFKQVAAGLWASRNESSIRALSSAVTQHSQQTAGDAEFFARFRALLKERSPEDYEKLLNDKSTTKSSSAPSTKITSTADNTSSIELDSSRVEMLHQYALSFSGLPDVQKRLLEPMGLKPSPRELLSLLQRLGLHSASTNPILIRFGAELSTCPPEILALAEQAVRSPPDPTRDRLRFDDLVCYTVDDPTALEIDDGLSYTRGENGSHWVYMHIADPTRFIAPNGPLDLFARSQAVTVYLPDRHFPMLPESVVKNCSLTPNVENHAFTVAVNLDAAANMLSYKVYPSILRRVKKLTYQYVDQLLKAPQNTLSKEEAETAQVMLSLNKLALARQKKRVALGAKVGGSYRPELRLDQSGFIVLSESSQTPSRDLVAEFMILANEVAAEFCIANRIPTPYRTQAAGQVKSDERTVRMRPSITSVYSNPHYGLGVPFYVHVTSPIRRYTDCLVHQNIRHHLAGQPVPYSAEMLAQIVEGHERHLRRVKSIQKHSAIYWTLKYLEQERTRRKIQGDADPLHDAQVAVPPRKEQLVHQPGQWADMITLSFPPTAHKVPLRLKSSSRPLLAGDKVTVRFVELDPVYEHGVVEIM